MGWVPLFEYLYHYPNVLDFWSLSPDGCSDRIVRIVDRLEFCELMARPLAFSDLEICILRDRRNVDEVFRSVSPDCKPDRSAEYALGTVARLDRRAANGACGKEGLAAAALVRYLERLAIGLVLTYLFDLFVSWNQPTDMLARYIPPAALRRILMPIVNQVLGAFLILAPNRPATLLLGHSYPHGTWLFFPVLFLLKSIPVFLVFLGAALAVGIWSRQSKARLTSTVPTRYQFHWRFLWVALSVYAVVCVFSRLDISIRHFTIPIALSILLVAPLPRLLGSLSVFEQRIPRIAGALVAVLALDSMVIAASHYPWFMPYHNFLAGNRPSYELFGDSNLDWNQGLFALEDFVRAGGLKRIPLDFYGASEPEPVIPQAPVWDCQAPA